MYGRGDLASYCPEGSAIALVAVDDAGRPSKPFRLSDLALAWICEWREPRVGPSWVATRVAIGANTPGRYRRIEGRFVRNRASMDVSGRYGQGWGTGGRRFKSGRPDQENERTTTL